MLSRETCEALRVLSGVRGHQWDVGDAAWVEQWEDGSYWVACWFGDDVFYDATTRERHGQCVWVPTLSDLLAMALARAIRPVSLMHVREWEFGEWGYGPEDVDGASGATPEEAVAAWLLARAR